MYSSCAMCRKRIKSQEVALRPSQCYQKYGSRSHQICQQCWFNKFATEIGNHRCPGCVKKLPLPPKPDRKPKSNAAYVIEIN